jgi:hypothetical protein
MSSLIAYVGTTIERSPHTLPAILPPIVMTENGQFLVGGSNPLKEGHKVSEAQVSAAFEQGEAYAFEAPLVGPPGHLVLDYAHELPPMMVDPADLDLTLTTLAQGAMDDAEAALQSARKKTIPIAIDRLFYAVQAEPKKLFQRLALCRLLRETVADPYVVMDYEERLKKATSTEIKAAIRWGHAWPALQQAAGRWVL